METQFEQARQHFLEGIAHFEGGRLEAARASFETALALAAGRPSVLANLGITLFHMKHWHEAIPLLRQALAAEPDQPEAWLALGLSHQALAQWGEAADALTRGLELKPGQPELWMTCGNCWANAGQTERAIAAYDRVLALDPTSAPAWSARGGVLREQGRLVEAAECFEKALALGADPTMHQFYLAATRGEAAPSAPPRAYVEALFDQYAADYDRHLVEQLRYCGHERLLQPLLGTGRLWHSVIDLGCGTGLCGRLLAGRARSLIGVDLSAAMLDKARAAGVYSRLVQADLVAFLQNQAPRADLVLAADVFIYVGALEAVFASVRRVLEPGGCFAFTVERADDEDVYRLQPSLRYAHSESYVRRLAARHGYSVRELIRAPLRRHAQAPLDALYVYLE